VFNTKCVVFVFNSGVPAIVDLAGLRDAMKRLGGNPKDINPLVPVDLVVDHSVQVDAFGSYVFVFIFLATMHVNLIL